MSSGKLNLLVALRWVAGLHGSTILLLHGSSLLRVLVIFVGEEVRVSNGLRPNTGISSSMGNDGRGKEEDEPSQNCYGM